MAAAQAASVEPHFWSLVEAAGRIRNGRTSSEELTRLCLDRIERRDKKLNAFITLTAEQALEQARALDRQLRQGEPRGPLHGVPIALKDNIDTAGVRTTAASRIYQKRVPDEDAEVTRRVLGAGAVLLGKLNLDEWAFEGTGTTSFFGPVHNPWDTTRIAGGSSAGSAAALADGLCYGSVGSDDGGSVRIPGSHCGVVGFKPTYGRVSTRGIIPSAYSLDCAGPMSRTVEDAAVLLGVLAGYDPRDAITVDAPVPDYRAAIGAPVSHLRVGVPRDYFFEGLDADVAARVEDAVRLARGMVREVRDVNLPRFQFVAGGSVDIELYHYHRELLARYPDQYHPWSRKQLEAAGRVAAAAYVETLKRIREARRDIRRTFAEVDVLLLPTMREPAPEVHAVMEGRYRRPPSNVSAFNRFGVPALTLCCGYSGRGLPVGLQVVGPAFGEAVVLSLAHAIERAGGWNRRHPA